MSDRLDPGNLKYLLDCGICLESFTDPRVLPCQHSYCMTCLQTHVTATRTTGGTFRCPHCREEFMAPRGDVRHYPKNIFANSLKDVVSFASLEQVEGACSTMVSIKCIHEKEEGSKEIHGNAIVFCPQCDAQLCRTCSDSHQLVAELKSHALIPVGHGPGGGGQLPSPTCERHSKQMIDWYCRDCTLPACAHCILESHKTHDTEKLSIVAAAFKQELLDVPNMATKRIRVLQQMSGFLQTTKIRMEADLDGLGKNISKAASRWRSLITQHESSLLTKVGEIREFSGVRLTKAMKELEISSNILTSLKSGAETLLSAADQFPLYTVLRAPTNKQQFYHQHDVLLPSFQWTMDKGSTTFGNISTASSLAKVEMQTSTESTKHNSTERRPLGQLVQEMSLGHYEGKKALCGIAPIYQNLVCVSHFVDKFIWVYTRTGEFKDKIRISGIPNIRGMVTIDRGSGLLAIVGVAQKELHFLTLSEGLKVLKHEVKDVPLVVPNRLSMNWRRELVINNTLQQQVVVLNHNGETVNTLDLVIPEAEHIIFVSQSNCGFVILNRDTGKVHFTDNRGQIVSTYSCYDKVLHAAATSWGHVLVVGRPGFEIRVFSEWGHLLGQVIDKNNMIRFPEYLVVDEEEGHLYIGCGPVKKRKILIYNLVESDLPSPHVGCNVTKLAVTASVAEI